MPGMTAKRSEPTLVASGWRPRSVAQSPISTTDPFSTRTAASFSTGSVPAPPVTIQRPRTSIESLIDRTSTMSRRIIPAQPRRANRQDRVARPRGKPGTAHREPKEQDRNNRPRSRGSAWRCSLSLRGETEGSARPARGSRGAGDAPRRGDAARRGAPRCTFWTDGLWSERGGLVAVVIAESVEYRCACRPQRFAEPLAVPGVAHHNLNSAFSEKQLTLFQQGKCPFLERHLRDLSDQQVVTTLVCRTLS